MRNDAITQGHAPATLQYDAPGVLVPCKRDGQPSGEACFITAEGSREVLCAIEAPRNLRWNIWRVRADLLPMPNGDIVVTAARNDATLDPLAFTPDAFSPTPGSVQAVRDFVAALAHPSLRQFVSDIFATKWVFRAFWRARGGFVHHHWTGGLAAHSLDVANRVADAFSTKPPSGEPWSADERDLILVCAFVHDLGECRDDGCFLEEHFANQREIMELRHQEIIHDALGRLYNTQRRLAQGLIELLFPRQRFAPSGLRVDAMRLLLRDAHMASVESGHRPAPSAMSEPPGVTPRRAKP